MPYIKRKNLILQKLLPSKLNQMKIFPYTTAVIFFLAGVVDFPFYIYKGSPDTGKFS